jgi:PAS domain S-box-containing protein
MTPQRPGRSWLPPVLRPPYGMRTLLTVPFALQLTGALALVGYLSFANSQSELLNLARTLEIETADRITHNVKTQIEDARQLTATNAGLIEQGTFDSRDFDLLGDLFTQQLKVTPVSYISFGNTQGEFVGLERTKTGLRFNRVSAQTGLKKLLIYPLNDQGDRQSQLPSKTWDPQSEAWYSEAVKHGSPLWTSIYVWEDQPDILSISLSYPIYLRQPDLGQPDLGQPDLGQPATPKRELSGVVSVDLILTDLSDFLKQLKIGRTGRALIVEPNGTIVASSYDRPVEIRNGKAQRRQLNQAQDPISKAIWSLLQSKTHQAISSSDSLPDPALSSSALSSSAQSSPTQSSPAQSSPAQSGVRSQTSPPQILTIDGERQFATVTHLQDELGLNWSIVVIVPESDFMVSLWSHARRTLLLCLGILALTLLGYLWLGDRLTRSIRQLTKAVCQLSIGHWTQTLPTSVLREVQQLSHAFGQMAQELDCNFQALQDTKALLETRVDARTAQLQATNRMLLEEICERERSEGALRLAEEKYRSIFENAVEGIFQVSSSGKFLSANPALAQIYGYESPEELVATLQDVEHQLYVLPDRRTQFVTELERTGHISNFESEIYRRDRSRVWISEHARVVRHHSSDQILYYEGIVQDISLRKQMEKDLEEERQRTENLLLDILPRSIAERLKQGDEETIADSFDEATVLFADLVNFTDLSTQITATDLVLFLNRIFCAFDALAETYGLEKIKTIGDAYMAVSGLHDQPVDQVNQIESIADMALDMIETTEALGNSLGHPIQLRIGIHCGPVVGGVIGRKRFLYDLWGDTVNVASRMESLGEAGGIQVTEKVYDYLKYNFELDARGLIAVKGKGLMTTYWLKRRKMAVVAR